MAAKKETLGITRRALGDLLIIEVDMKKAKFKDKAYLSLSAADKKHYDDLLYLSNVQTGNPRIIYK